MTDVNRRNFREVFDNDIKPAIDSCDFLAFDLEFTGLHSAKFRRHLDVDSMETRYLGVKNSAENFTLLQFGLCAMTWVGQSSSYIAKP